MKLDRKEYTRKQYIHFEKRLNELYELERQIPWTAVAKPYQDGWNIVPTLRDDYLRSKKGQIGLELVKKFYSTYTIKSAKMVALIRKDRSYEKVLRLMPGYGSVWFTGKIESISEKEWGSLLPQHKPYFSSRWSEIRIHWGMNKDREKVYELAIPIFYVQFKVEKRIITHTRDIDSNVRSEMAELRALLEPYWRSAPGSGYRSKHDEVMLKGRRKESVKKHIKEELTEFKARSSQII